MLDWPGREYFRGGRSVWARGCGSLVSGIQTKVGLRAPSKAQSAGTGSSWVLYTYSTIGCGVEPLEKVLRVLLDINISRKCTITTPLIAVHSEPATSLGLRGGQMDERYVGLGDRPKEWGLRVMGASGEGDQIIVAQCQRRGISY